MHKEHIVPLNVIARKLMVLPKDVSLNEIEKLLEKYLRYATIIKNEDKVLNSQGLRSKMPNEFYEVGHALCEDVFARYKIIGLTLYKKNKKYKKQSMASSSRLLFL